MPDWLDALSLLPVPAPLSELDDVLGHWAELSGPAFERAVVGAIRADRLGLAFAVGYRSALLALGGRDDDAALCVTEEGGAHPRAIKTQLDREGDQVILTGNKRWATLARRARSLLVAASIGRTDSRNELRMVRVPIDAEGVHLIAQPPTAFTPEIPHYSITLDKVRVPATAVLDGDGYAAWIKPFRTIEDIHVIAAATAHLIAVGRRAGWGTDRLLEGLAIVTALASLASRPPLEPGVHLALGGVLSSFEGWLDRLDGSFTGVEPAIRERFTRDRPLLRIAGRARAARLARACELAGLDPG